MEATQTTSEALSAWVEDGRALINRLSNEGREEIEAATDATWQAVREYNAASSALEDGDNRAEALKQERLRLPVKHSEAVLAEDLEQQEQIKIRYSEIAAELEDWQARRAELVETIQALSGPNTEKLPAHLRHIAVGVYQRQRVAKDLGRHMDRFSKLDREVVREIEKARSWFARRGEELSALNQQQQSEIAADPAVIEARKRRKEAAARNPATHASSTNVETVRDSGPYPGLTSELLEEKRQRRQPVRPKLTNRPGSTFTTR